MKSIAWGLAPGLLHGSETLAEQPERRLAMSRITPDDLAQIAHLLVDRHGARAAILAGQAVAEMEAAGDAPRADAWRALRSVIEDAIEGRLPPAGSIRLH